MSKLPVIVPKVTANMGILTVESQREDVQIVIGVLNVSLVLLFWKPARASEESGVVQFFTQHRIVPLIAPLASEFLLHKAAK